MRRAQVVAGLGWALAGAYVAWSGWQLDLGAPAEPGPGFLLFWVGLLMVGLALGVTAGAARGTSPEPLWPDRRWRRVVAVVLVLVLYAVALPRLGFVLTTAGALLALFRLAEPRGWAVALAGAAAGAGGSWLLFKRWLGAPLPAGWLGLG